MKPSPVKGLIVSAAFTAAGAGLLYPGVKAQQAMGAAWDSNPKGEACMKQIAREIKICKDNLGSKNVTCAPATCTAEAFAQVATIREATARADNWSPAFVIGGLLMAMGIAGGATTVSALRKKDTGPKNG